MIWIAIPNCFDSGFPFYADIKIIIAHLYAKSSNANWYLNDWYGI